MLETAAKSKKLDTLWKVNGFFCDTASLPSIPIHVCRNRMRLTREEGKKRRREEKRREEKRREEKRREEKRREEKRREEKRRGEERRGEERRGEERRGACGSI